MQTANRPSWFKRFLFLAYVIAVCVLLAGRSHFITGTGLYLTRWFWVLLGLLFFIPIRKTGYTTRLKIITAVLSGLLLEFAVTQLSRATLTAHNCTTEFNVLTYNVFFKNKRPADALNIITQNAPDVIALQEVTPKWEQDLNTALDGTYPYKRMIALKGTHGMAVYSKHKITGDTVLNDDAGRPVALFIEMLVGGKQVLLINTHLASPAAAVEHPENFLPLYARSYALRGQQIDAINHLVASRYANFPVRMLTGDLNTLSDEPVYQHELLGNWINLFSEKGEGPALNFPNSSKTGPQFTLDYIFLQGNIEPIHAAVLKGGSSDHCAVWGRVRI